MAACDTITRQEVTLTYPVSLEGDKEAVRTVVWDDGGYREDSGDFNPETARVCAVMCACAGSSDTAQVNLDSLGFDKTAKFSYEKSYKGDRVGVLFSKKQIGDTTLIAVIIRGTVGHEWYSNFDIGYTEEHEGFASCADFVMDKLDMYIINYGLKDENLAYLVTGYSRGGAVANIAAKRLIDADRGTVYAYTFASPNTTTRSSGERYSSIFNLIRKEDFFTYVPLTEWGYRRYGTDIELDARQTATPDSVKTVFREITGDEYVGFDSHVPIESFLKKARELAPTVDDYYHRAYAVGDTTLTMYDYMMLAARFLSKEESDTDTDMLIDTLNSDFAEMTGFFMTGIDLEEILLTGNFTRSSVADSHSYVAYMASLDKYIESL